MPSVKDKIDALRIEKRAFIGGAFVNALDGETITKKSSADGRDLSGLASCKEADVNRAVSLARDTFKSRVWADKDPADKKAVMLRLADLMEENREELALLDTVETGRSFKNYYNDSIPKAIEVVRYFAESIDKIRDEAIPPRANAFATITREPLGVVGCITPWNDPMVPGMWKMCPALLMGNSVIMKPAEQSSFSMIKVAALAKEAGIPDGVLSVLPGYGHEAGKALALHHDVDGVFFTGSSEVGKKILQYAGQSNMKRVGLECGGKSAFIVSDKCGDLKDAASVLAQNIFYNQGQICSAPSRALVHQDIHDEFMDYIKKEANKYVPADPFDMDSEVGCVVSCEQKERVERYIQQGKDAGFEIYETVPGYDGGEAISPVIFDHVDPQSPLAQEEIFGPVLTVMPVSSVAEAIDIANDTDYGLAAAIFTDDIHEAYQASRLLKSGIVHINSYGDDDNTVPFGGVKQSGQGKDKSMDAFDDYSDQKTVWMQFKSLGR